MTARHKFVQPLQLAQTQSSLHFGHTVIEAQIDLLVIPRTIASTFHFVRIARDAVRPQQRDFVRQIRAVGQAHGALAGGDDFHGMETEHSDVAVLPAAHCAAAITCAHRVRCVFNHGHAVFVRQLLNRRHVARFAAQMHRQHFGQPPCGFGARQFFRQCVRRQIPRLRVDIDKIHVRAAIQRTVGRSDKRGRRGPQQVARPQAQRQTRQMQRGGGIAHGHGMLRAAIIRQRLLERGHAAALC